MEGLMINKPLNFRNIFKRKRILTENRVGSIHESYSGAANSKFTLNSSNLLPTLEQLYFDNNFAILEDFVNYAINNIVPGIQNSEFPAFKKNILRSNIGESNKDKLIESTNMYKKLDRIEKNHNNLSKKFTLEAFTNKAKSDKERFYSICEMVDTFDIDTHIKLGIALEESMYLSYIEDFPIDESSLVENTLDYFLMHDNMPSDAPKRYLNIIKESDILSNTSTSNIQWFEDIVSGEDFTNITDYAPAPEELSSIYGDNWKDKLNLWKVKSDKDTSSLLEMIKSNLGDMNALRKITETYQDYININGIDSNYSDFISTLSESISLKEAKNIFTLVKESGGVNEEFSPILESIVDIFMEEANDEVYADNDEDDGTHTFSSDKVDKYQLNSLVKDAQSAGEFLDQIEKTSMKNLPVSITKIYSMEDGKKKTISESNINDYIDNNEHLSLNVRSHSYSADHSKGDTIDTIYEFAKSVNGCINNILHNRDSRSYFVIGESSIDFYIRSKYHVYPVSESSYQSRDFSTLDKMYICEIARSVGVLESIFDSPYFAIVEKLQDRFYAARISLKEFNLISDILSPYAIGEDNIISEFVKLCEEEDNKYYKNIKASYMNTVKESFNIFEDPSIRLNFAAKVMGINEDMIDDAAKNVKSAAKGAVTIGRKAINDAKNKAGEIAGKAKDKVTGKSSKKTKEASKKLDAEKDKASDDKDQKDDDDDGGIGDIDFTDAANAWEKTKATLDGASAKEKEISRDVDTEFNHLTSKLKKLVTVDHRDGIIAGQVNLSLSKTVKMAIAFAGIGYFAGKAVNAPALAIVLPVFFVINKLIRSKFLSTKDRKMILDQIDVELKVIEREIQRAESSGSNRKYRQLLIIQKNLQRRRQEIYFGFIKQGKRIPMQSTVGLRERD